ncbi:MAG: radical SAM protein [Myxococcales bacterium]|nr:radical SAM protein [Myxococcales bacterium]MCB9579616.1 radical SAM protein [Polyangiaceae bacterium]
MHPGQHPHAAFGPEPGFLYSQAPRRVYWELTRACGLACRHCRAEAQKTRAPEELSTEEAFGVLRSLADAKPTPVVVLTGGDPLERPDFFDILDYAKSLKLHVDVAPSVTPKLTREAVEKLADHGVGAMSLSLDGSDPERHDSLRGIPGVFERTLEAADIIADSKIPLQVNTLVTANTLADLPAIHSVVARMKAKRWSLFFLVTTGRGSLLPQIEPAQAEELFDWLIEMGPKSPFVIATTEAPQFRRYLLKKKNGSGDMKVPGAGIRDGNGIMFISYKGDVMPSGFLPLSAGTVREENPLELYRHSDLFTKLRDTKSFSGRCGSCDLKDVCGGSRGRAFAATGNPLAEDPLCTYQPS